jgi:hypothetical protein
VVESTALEMRRTGNRTVGSNPTLSATQRAEKSQLFDLCDSISAKSQFWTGEAD